eukprot:jgi/Picre1/28278/NNA_003684.t1
MEPVRRVEKVTRETQDERVKAVGVKLPILGRSAAGDSILDFSLLFKSMVLEMEEKKEAEKVSGKRTVLLKQRRGQLWMMKSFFWRIGARWRNLDWRTK